MPADLSQMKPGGGRGFKKRLSATAASKLPFIYSHKKIDREVYSFFFRTLAPTTATSLGFTLKSLCGMWGVGVSLRSLPDVWEALVSSNFLFIPNYSTPSLSKTKGVVRDSVHLVAKHDSDSYRLPFWTLETPSLLAPKSPFSLLTSSLANLPPPFNGKTIFTSQV